MQSELYINGFSAPQFGVKNTKGFWGRGKRVGRGKRSVKAE